MKKQILILSFLFSVSSNACPLGIGESELTFARVMQNFGRLLLRSDAVVREGVSNPSMVTNTKIEEALEGLNGAISCAQMSLDARDSKLLPRKGQSLSGDALKVYRTNYNKFMGEFKAILESYKTVFETALKADPGNRDFSKGVIIEKQIRDKASEAHQAI